MHAREGLSEAVRLSIKDEIDIALAIEGDALGAMPGDGGKPHSFEEGTQLLRLRGGVFDEFETVRSHRIGWIHKPFLQTSPPTLLIDIARGTQMIRGTRRERLIYLIIDFPHQY